MKYIFKFLLLALGVLVILFLLGPRAPKPVLVAQIHSLSMADLVAIQTAESQNQLIKPGNEALTFGSILLG
jgi:hypothetical protein